jgi:hypothetical protein
LQLKAALLLIASVLSQAICSSVVYAEAVSLQSCPARMLIHNNGTILFDGKIFTDQVQLKAYLKGYKTRFPKCRMAFSMDDNQNIRFETLGRVLLLLQETGFEPGVGFVTKPRG